MFYLLGSGVLDEETEAGLVSHLNEQEFLGEYGLHSLAKGDPAYDPADVDNGGPGACTSFPPNIAIRLYQAGQPREAAGPHAALPLVGQPDAVLGRLDLRRPHGLPP